MVGALIRKMLCTDLREFAAVQCLAVLDISIISEQLRVRSKENKTE